MDFLACIYLSSHFRQRDVTPENRFFVFKYRPINVYPRAYVFII